MNGWLIINKETGLLSMDVVRALKTLFKKVKIGHAGTLDPFASGVLPIALGNATKVMPFVYKQDKEYYFEAQFGSITDTLDCDGKIVLDNQKIPTYLQIQACLKNFIGSIWQTPPLFSAVKINGKRAYNLAREGKKFELTPKKVNIYELKFLHYNNNIGFFKIRCGSGTYIRSLVRDIAKSLETVAYVIKLHRNRVGNWIDHNAISLANFKKLSHKEMCLRILPISSAFVKEMIFELTNFQAEQLLKNRNVAYNLVSFNETEGCAVANDEVLGLVKYLNGMLTLKKNFKS